MNERDIRPGKLEEGHENFDSKDIEMLKGKMLDMQLEIDILKETIDVLKKDPGIDQTALQNREKAVIVDALKNKYSLSLILEKLKLAKSCFITTKRCLHKKINIFLSEKKSKTFFMKIRLEMVTEEYMVCFQKKALLFQKK